ncbi:phosphate ABC transporter substrate-binding protein PstS [Alicyclobacillus macrosporangiidus]|uniref:Phosphate-binding protein n=1 Tax=Alicyclobacillus macrosporangiidus TaxID=392015 RepID=A0A1I7F861_9BACL|nr:phosphate ABC transporter substrate-binding protein PstS [Alicyclobacillus macrosporangiidus]SFU32381.1 phosphate transport system substrate-binding protein [Alicyclobacillus macrosporangiidus]
MLKSRWAGAALALSAVIATAGCGAATNNTANAGNAVQNTAGATTATAPITINETGSSLLYPLFNGQWIEAYKSVDPNVSITAASTGSGTGIAQAIAGTVQIGASDAYLSDAQMQQNPSMVNIPLAISAQQVMYNVPGLTGDQHLKLSGDVLAKIFSGKIKVWDDAAITSLNPGVKLPHQPIIPVHRSDSSGDTFLFTQFLSDTSADWKNAVGFGTSVSWPAVAGAIGVKGNDGVVQALASNKYSIGYVGISWLDKATQQGLGYAALKNKDGNFVLPAKENIQAAAQAGVSNVPDDERISLIDEPGANSYPIINFEYAIVNTKQPADMAAALKKFLNWAIDPNGGNKDQYLSPVHFLPLPAEIESKSQAQINKIGG